MKYLKIFGLTAVAAMALMAFLGASSASATVLCKVEVNTTTGVCPANQAYPANTVIDGSLEESATLWVQEKEETLLDTCTTSTVKGKTTNEGSSTETVVAHVEELLWEGCTKETKTKVNGSLEIHWIPGTDNGTLTGINQTVTVKTIFGGCTYGTAGTGTDLGTLKGGSMGTISVATYVPLIEAEPPAVCPSKAWWTAKYTITSPEPLYIGTST